MRSNVTQRTDDTRPKGGHFRTLKIKEALLAARRNDTKRAKQLRQEYMRHYMKERRRLETEQEKRKRLDKVKEYDYFKGKDYL